MQTSGACLLYTGAGWSSMSGLSTYETLRESERSTHIKYADIFNAQKYGRKIGKAPRVIKPVWEYVDKMKTDYLRSEPHEYYQWFDDLANDSYKVDSRWEELYNQNDQSFNPIRYTKAMDLDNELLSIYPTPRRFFVKTSNVDGLFYKSCIPNHEVYSMHGCLLDIQCLQGRHNWIGRGQNELIPACTKCPSCNSYTRPNVLMFNDRRYVERVDEKENYDRWIRTAIDYLKETGESLLVFDIGVGQNVQDLVYEIDRVCTRFAKSGVEVNRVRINPDRRKLLFYSGRYNVEKFDSLSEYVSAC